MLARWDFSRILQIMHAEGIQNRGSFQWMHFFEPPAEALARFGESEHEEPDWSMLEPEFSPP